MYSNYHTHTNRCNHAIGADENYVQRAIQGGFQILGFSDHTPWPFENGYHSPIRMRMDELDSYVLSIETLRERYRDQIEIKIGLECEFYTRHIEWLREQKERLKLDYLILGNHFPYSEQGSFYVAEITSYSDLEVYIKSSIEAMESGLYDCFAHPDLFMRSYPSINNRTLQLFRELATAARDLGVAFERNIPTIYHRELWEVVADVQPRVIIGVDAHDSKLLKSTDQYDAQEVELNALGIKPIKQLL